MTKVDDYISGITDWRRDVLAELRTIINEAGPELTEDFKWNLPVWTHNGMVCAISAFKDHVKVNFFKGVYLKDTYGVINNGLESKEHRSIDFAKDDPINKKALADLVAQATKYNQHQFSA